MSKLREIYTTLFHRPCVQSCIDQANKQERMHQTTIMELQATIEDLQSEIARLNKEILFTQEGYELQIKQLTGRASGTDCKAGN